MPRAYRSIDELDVAFYVSHHADLRGLSADEARSHYVYHGQREGRAGLPGATRESLTLERVSHHRFLEIGPFGKPFLAGPNVRYADYYSTGVLRLRAQDIPDLNPDDCPVIHHVLSDMSLRDVPDRFSAAFSSHCIEHQPDLIGHLNDVASVLEAGAPYVVVVPDKRYCFDHFASLSTMADIVAASLDRRKAHTTDTVLTNLLLSTHNDMARHWAGDHGKPAGESGDRAWLDAIETVRSRQGVYVDAHAWRFVPAHFAEICEKLHALGLIELCPEAVFETPRHRMEFCAIFRRGQV